VKVRLDGGGEVLEAGLSVAEPEGQEAAERFDVEVGVPFDRETGVVDRLLPLLRRGAR
jgi:hypothetical protein